MRAERRATHASVKKKSKRSSEVGSVLEVGESDAQGRKTQEKERAKNMEPQMKKQSTTANQANDGPHRRTWSLLVEPPAGRVLNRGISIRHEITGHLRRAPEVEETASLTSHGRASGQVRRHDRHLATGCKPRHDPLGNNAHTGPTTQSTLRRQPASRGSGEPPNKPPTLEMPREATQQRTRRAEEPKENKHTGSHQMKILTSRSGQRQRRAKPTVSESSCPVDRHSGEDTVQYSEVLTLMAAEQPQR